MTCSPVILAFANLWIGTLASPVPQTDLLVNSPDVRSVLRFDGLTGAFQGNFIPTPRLPGSPLGMEFGPDGDLYVVIQYELEGVHRYDGETGAELAQFIPPLNSQGFGSPHDLRFGRDGHLYVLYGSNNVGKFNGTTGELLGEFVGPGNGPALSFAQHLTFGPDGHLYISSYHTDSVQRYHGVEGFYIDDFIAPGSGGLDGAAGILFTGDGRLFVTSSLNSTIKRYDASTGAYLEDFIPSGSGGLSHPHETEMGADGYLYTTGNGGIRRYNGLTGAFVDNFIPEGSGGLFASSYIAFFPELTPVPALTCQGFEPPADVGPLTVKGNRVLPLKARLVDQLGLFVTGSDLVAAPALQVLFYPGQTGTPIDVTDQALAEGLGTDGNQFVFTGDRWQFNLQTKGFSAVGRYVVSMISGDPAEYVIDPTCEVAFLKN